MVRQGSREHQGGCGGRRAEQDDDDQEEKDKVSKFSQRGSDSKEFSSKDSSLKITKSSSLESM